MSESSILNSIKNVVPVQAKESFLASLKSNEELITVLASFELQNPYNISFTIQPNKNPQPCTLYEAIGKVCYWLSLSDFTAARGEFRKLSDNHQQVIKAIFGNIFQKYVGRDFTLDNLPRLYELQDLYASFIKLPQKLESSYEEHLEGFSRSFSLSESSFPAYSLTIPKNSRKSSKLYYIVKKGNSIHSNIKNKVVISYFRDNFHYNNFGCIFLYSKRDHKRYGKHLIPLCISLNYTNILNLYRGSMNVNLGDFDFECKKYFGDLKSNYIDIKYTSVSMVASQEDFRAKLPRMSENNIMIFNNGITKVRFKIKQRNLKVVDFILNTEYIPIGLIGEDGKHYYCNISDSFVDGGLENRFVTIHDTYFDTELVKSSLYDLSGTGLFQCKLCGSVTKTHSKGLCSSCYRKLAVVSEFCGDSGYVLPIKSFEPFSIKLWKCDINADNEVKFVVNYENAVGRQLSLPFEDFIGD